MADGRTPYVYKITSRAEVTNDYVFSHGNVELPGLPNFDEQGFKLPLPENEPVRQIEIEIDARD